MESKADLHLHTIASDGTWTPVGLVEAALQAGLSMIAVTDHDTTSAVLPAQEHGNRLGLEVVAGVELSVRNDTEEIHLIGLGIRPDDAGLQEIMAQMRESREGRARKMISRLADLGMPISQESVHEFAGSAAVGRPHVARALVEAGYVATIGEAFEHFLAEGRPAYVPQTKVTPEAAIAAVHRAGGVAVCAHPGLLKDDAILPGLIDAGLDAIEAYHSKHSLWQTRRYLALADQLNVLVSAGSDCHGPGYRNSVLLGSVTLPLDKARRLLAACERS